MGMGVTVKINHTFDADTAEYLVKEFGHNPVKEEKAEEILEKIKEIKRKYPHLKIIVTGPISMAPVANTNQEAEEVPIGLIMVGDKIEIRSGEYTR